MADTIDEIPERDLFKASEVCDLAKVQPYVLRSWEQEFPNLGVAHGSGGQRIYRRTDVERVLQIKQLVFGEGLTLAGVRRRLDGNGGPEEDAELPALLDDKARIQLAEIRSELRALLDMLDGRSGPGSISDSAQPSLPEMEGDGAPGGMAWPPRGRGGARKGSGRSRPQQTRGSE